MGYPNKGGGISDPPQNKYMARRIVILSHPIDKFAESPYMLNGVATQWREGGFEVTVNDDPDKKIDADIAILHVDLTVVPDAYMEFMKRYPLAINARVRDISKRHISSDIVRYADRYKGPVIIKTNLNCGGAAEGILAQETSLIRKLIRG